jgi:spermidine synthase
MPSIADVMPIGESGAWRITEDAANFRCLWEGNTIWMVGGTREESMHAHAVAEAHKRGGVVLTTGLGLGMFPDMCLESPTVERVDIVERCADVIALAWPTLQDKHGDRVCLIVDDATQYTPSQRYSVIWHDYYQNEDVEAAKAAVESRYAEWCDWQGFWRVLCQ